MNRVPALAYRFVFLFTDSERRVHEGEPEQAPEHGGGDGEAGRAD